MNNDVDPGAGTNNTRPVANVADKVSKAGIIRRRQHLLHFELLQLITAEDHQAAGFIVFQDGLDEMLSERTCSAGNQYGFPIK